MDEITFEDLLLLSPLSDDLKKEIRDKYPNFSSAQQMEVQHILWRSYRILKRFIRQQVYAEYNKKIVEGTYTPPVDYDLFIERETEKRIAERKHSDIQDQGLQDVRSKLAEFINLPK